MPRQPSLPKALRPRPVPRAPRRAPVTDLAREFVAVVMMQNSICADHAGAPEGIRRRDLNMQLRALDERMAYLLDRVCDRQTRSRRDRAAKAAVAVLDTALRGDTSEVAWSLAMDVLEFGDAEAEQFDGDDPELVASELLRRVLA